ncbi:Inner membrane protein YccF [bioreactor metagenome]|uniref:Inner membrane protein YccF n=1 Tax=bioreactor metagenome TaxID=1076179 RepID=A0A645HZP6_9ZZZZ|nr:YccF domain-containing protein [Erysipelotrichaceae bacterium]
MKTLGNILWIIFGGLETALGWLLLGVIFCITIIGIPVGKQCFKFARLTLTPFGSVITTNFGAHPVGNILWVIFIGLWMAASNILIGVLCCITIIGIPFGKQWFKLAKLSFAPFGANIA